MKNWLHNEIKIYITHKQRQSLYVGQTKILEKLSPLKKKKNERLVYHLTDPL